MKKRCTTIVSVSLVLVFLLASSGTVLANSPQPTVTLLSGNAPFSLSFADVSALPAASVVSSGNLLLPAGFPVGEKQFEGQAIRVSGLAPSTAKACFPITALNQGWGGQVAAWNGTQWELLTTTFNTPSESTISWACATITGDGTYALLAWAVDPSKLVDYYPPSCGEMAFAYPYDFHLVSDVGWVMSIGEIYSYFPIPVGTTVSFQILNVEPPGSFTSGLSGSGVVTLSEEYEPVPGVWHTLVTFDPAVVFHFSSTRYTWRVFLPGCYADFNSDDIS
jgi:hypothetical protein